MARSLGGKTTQYTLLDVYFVVSRFENESQFKWTKSVHLYGSKDGFIMFYPVDSIGQPLRV